MLPVYPIDNETDDTAGDAESVGNHLMRQLLASINLANCQNLILSQLDHAMSSSFRACLMNSLVCLVLAVRHPPKIACPIIQGITVSMSHLMALRRARTIKYGADYHVYVDARSCAKKDAGIAAGYKAMAQNNARLPTFPVPLVSDKTIHRSHTPQVGRFIAGMTRHWPPLFNFCYGFLSHVALLQRGGQGMTEGSNRPSFPIYNGRQSRSSGISILAVRV